MLNMKNATIDPNREIFVIVDANSWVHSCFHACPPVLDKKGVDQRVLNGMLAMLSSIVSNLPRIDYLMTVFDPPDGDLFRKSKFSAYKANRPPQDEDLKRQKRDSMHVFKNILGIPDLTYSGYEADDIIGSASKIISKEIQVVIVSIDKDLAQLVTEKVILMRRVKTKDFKGYQFLDPMIVKDEFGVHPIQIPDYLALMGDTADNLPGLEKVGPKTAAKIINNHFSIENILRDVSALDETLREKVEGSRETLKMVKELATIYTDLPLGSLIDAALDHSANIRGSNNFRNNLLKAENFFKWNPGMIDMFLFD